MVEHFAGIEDYQVAPATCRAACDRWGHHHFQRGLAALQSITAQIVTIQLDQVEGIKEDALVSAVVTDEIERGNAFVITGDTFAINDAGARAQASQRIDNQRKRRGRVRPLSGADCLG
jgi:hypothetical protein